MTTGSLYTKGRGGEGGKGTLRDAATVILLRDRAQGGCELFLMRRHADQAFMGGAHVFPGGRLDEADRLHSPESLAGGFDGADARRRLQEEGLPESGALGLFAAAIRETFEESGVLLARDGGGGTVDWGTPERAARFLDYREALQQKRLTLAELFRQEGLVLAPDLLTPYARWITPEPEPRRYDTRFFLARLPEGQRADHDRLELTDSAWMTPAGALSEHEAGRIRLMPPTLKTIEELLPFRGTEELFAAAARRRIRPILPEPFRTADGFGVRLANDAEYTLNGGGEPPCLDGSTRIVFEGGIWRTRSV